MFYTEVKQETSKKILSRSDETQNYINLDFFGPIDFLLSFPIIDTKAKTIGNCEIR